MMYSTTADPQRLEACNRCARIGYARRGVLQRRADGSAGSRSMGTLYLSDWVRYYGGMFKFHGHRRRCDLEVVCVIGPILDLTKDCRNCFQTTWRSPRRPRGVRAPRLIGAGDPAARYEFGISRCVSITC